MKYLIILILLSGCKTYERNVISQRLMNDYGIIGEVNYEHAYYAVYWSCADPRWKNQPCFGISEHPLRIGIVVGDTVKLKTK